MTARHSFGLRAVPPRPQRTRFASLASQPQAVVDLIEDAVRETAG
ncbi:hypothetical protein [Streptomyces cyaneofuscatus]